MARGRGRCGEPQTWLCTVGVTVAVLSAGAARRRVFSSDTWRAGGVARVCCCVVCLVGNYAALTRPRWVPQSPCCAVLSLFLAVTRRLCMLPGSALNAPAVLVNTALFLDVVDAGAYVLSCFAVPRIPGARRILPVKHLSISCRGLGR